MLGTCGGTVTGYTHVVRAKLRTLCLCWCGIIVCSWAPVQNQVARPTLDRANAGISSEIWYAVRGDESR